jgi:DNA-3-methyladenine glycosylase II
MNEEAKPRPSPAAHKAMRKRERELAALDPVMARIIESAGPCTMQARLETTPFESLASSIAHQQLNGAVAQRILQRFVALYAPAPFPEPAALRATDETKLRAVGFSFAKIRALHDLADKTMAGVVPASHELVELEDDHIIERLTQVRGIGPWTVHMMLMFQLGRPNVLPIDDYGVRNGFRLAYGLKGLPTPRALREFGERWHPHCSIAAWYLWRAVDLAREGKLPKPSRPPRVAIQKQRVARKPTRGAKPKRRVKPKQAAKLLRRTAKSSVRNRRARPKSRATRKTG